MHQKVHALLDEALLRRLQAAAERQGKTLDELLGEALRTYLTEAEQPTLLRKDESVVARSWASLKLDQSQVEALLEHEPGLFDL